jgi:glucose/arabinose dehydrogenase/PKD repeat protein
VSEGRHLLDVRVESVIGGRARIAVVACVVIGLLVLPSASRATLLPLGFAEQVVVNVSRTTAFAFVPDGRMVITSQLGQIFVYDGDQTAPTRAVDLNALGLVCNNAERGLLGVAVDPAFSAQHYVYVYYTFRKNGNCGMAPSDVSTQPVNRVSRFLLGGDDLIDPASEQVLIDNIPSPSGTHNAGDVQFGKDGYLYVSVGDGGCDYVAPYYCGPQNSAARDPNVLLGKVLRITRDGQVPPNNPYVGTGTSRCNLTGQTAPGNWCRETYAWGLRNPFRIAFDPDANGTRFYVNDVGLNSWEEVDEGQPGADYGWNVREGQCATESTTDCGPPPAGMTNPIYDYQHVGGCSSITGGVFVPRGAWPASYDSHYLYADFVCQKIFDLTPDGAGGFLVTEFGTSVPQPLGMQFGPYGSGQALYYASYQLGSVRRVAFVGGANRSPNASATASPTDGALPLAVGFDARQSSDPDKDTLGFDWDFGDGSAHASTAQVTHTYTASGVYKATVTVTDGHGGQDIASVWIYAGYHGPIPQIETPLPDQHFAVGETVTLTGSASDPEDGGLPDSALTWEVIKHHAAHTHPFLPPTTGNNLQITGPVPEDLLAATNTYLEVRLTATDSQGLSSTITRALRPQLVNLGFETVPADLRVLVNGQTAPSRLTSWAGWRIELGAPNQTDAFGLGEVFVSWSDGGAQSHEITTPSADATYTATFTRYYARPRGAAYAHVSLVPAYRACGSPNRTHGSPLAFGSCTPAVQRSDQVTVGTPDANGNGVRSLGSVTLTVIVGIPSTPDDEADLRIATSITDVRKKSDLSDYTGEVQTVLNLRLTDRIATPNGDEPQTLQDVPFRVTVPCAPTDSTTVGSTCSLITSADTVMPGAAPEAKRSIWALDRVEVFDGGPDGDADTTGDNALFATQGVFVP